MLETFLIIGATAILTLVLQAIYIKRTLPNILSDVAIGAGESISQQLNETLAAPNVQRAFSILGKKSGEVRADNALREKAANLFVEQSPVIKMALEKIGISPLDGLKLLNDPLFAPTIQKFMASFQNKNSPGPGQPRAGAGSVPLMS